MKRILMVLTVAALLVAAMIVAAVPAFAAPCEKNPDHKHCVELNPGDQPQGCQGNNPNCRTVFDNPSPNN